MSDIYGIWYKKRTTPVVVSADTNSKARTLGRQRKKKGYGEIEKVAKLNEKDAKKAREGNWVRTRVDGKSPTESNKKSQYRSWL